MLTNRKLIIFSYDFPPSNGGIARLCQEIAVGMRLYYTSVTVLTRKKTGPNIPYNLNAVQVVELPTKRIVCELAAISYLSKLKDKNQYDILCGNWHPESFLSFISGFKNVFALGHGTEFLSGDSSFRKFIWLPYYGKLTLNKLKLIIANSNYTEKLIRQISDSGNAVALPLAVNHYFFMPLDKVSLKVDKLRLCTVSRIEHFKGHDFIANVIAKLPKEFRNKMEWNIAGTGPYLVDLIRLIKELGLENEVKFHGFVKDEDLPAFYSNNDLFILCSRENSKNTSVEGFGLVFLEAQSCGLPVIGTNTGGISDAIDNNNGGWLIKQDDEFELKNLLVNFLHDRSVLTNMGLKARERIVKYCTWEIYCAKLSELLNL
ncbi:glycosyltransferase family 4 protein [Flavobacterium sp. LS1R49]|uniref:Glycosyltransferase family 4 protein n=1 Tax=Flavobacterium shii TaxID=2987687 RepID=A0A9X3C5K7_9FLAO|nr:glycosyltransferase family 4 protein [Flavobacterium shii]MCV9927432.1 glycosyltransferase family 4 protein [Flavobacterium shii]